MQIKSIILYNYRGQTRTLSFRQGTVNIITGRSYTGKSALISIIEYCLGNSDFQVPDGVIRDYVAWYSVLFQVNEYNVFIAKPKPEGNRQRQPQGFLQFSQDEINTPSINKLELNSNDGDIRSVLNRLMRREETDDAKESQASDNLRTTLEYTLFYLFQKSNVILNPEILLHRQQEPGVPQSIKDSLPYFLAIVRESDILRRREYERTQSELRTLRSKLREAEARQSSQQNNVTGLMREAQEVGLISSDISFDNAQFVEDTLRQAAQLQPSIIPPITNDLVPQIQSELRELRREFGRIQDEIISLDLMLRESENYSREVNEQLMRLESINIFNNPDDLFSGLCPLCFSSLSNSIPRIDAIRQSLDKLNTDLQYVRRENPGLRSQLQSRLEERERWRAVIKDKETSIQSLLLEQENVKNTFEQAINTNSQISRVAGKILYHLQISDPIANLSILREQVNELEMYADELRKNIGSEGKQDDTRRVLNLLAKDMTSWASQLELAYTGLYYIDLKKLTVIADTNERSVPMRQMGGNQSVLGCHLIALLALHKQFAERNQPVPNFLILDQPAQGYFPSREVYEALEGRADELVNTETDIAAVERMFNLLFNVCKELNPNFQIIVLEHANLNSSQFQAALVENPWTSDNALIPKDWLNQESADQLSLF